MERKMMRELIEWRRDPYRKPLIITGCRQTGKTYIVKAFAESEYRNCIYINFGTMPEKRRLFDGSLDSEELISHLTISENTRFYEDDTLIVLDEIQYCTAAYSSLKSFSVDRRCDVIAIGPSLTFDSDDGHISPLGHVDIKHLHPMDFEEYLWAMDIDKGLIDMVKEHLRDKRKVPDYFDMMLSDHFRRYMVIGGMPEAVNTYATTKDYVRTSKVLDSIIELLMKDARRHSSKKGYDRIYKCLSSIPRQLSRDDKRFHYIDVDGNKDSGKRRYGDSLDRMLDAGLVLKCLNLNDPDHPLSEHALEDSFKIYMADTGILMRLMKDVNTATVVFDDPFIDHCSLVENAMASALSKKGYDLYFYAKRNSTLRIDLVTDIDDSVALIDVRSGRNKRSKSLNTLMSEKNRNRKGYKIMDTNIEYDENGILHLPLYAISLMDDPIEQQLPVTESSEMINKRFEEYKGSID